jgi:hypothetical protein
MPARTLAGSFGHARISPASSGSDAPSGARTTGPAGTFLAQSPRESSESPAFPDGNARAEVGSSPSRGALDRPAKAGRFCFTARPVSGVRAGWRKRRRFRGQTRVGAGRRALCSGRGSEPPTATLRVPVGLSAKPLKLSPTLGSRTRRFDAGLRSVEVGPTPTPKHRELFRCLDIY